MKIGHFQNQGEKRTLSSFLVNYRDTPHSATGVSSAQMIFRCGYQGNFLNKSLSDQEINTARLRDQNKKTDRENVYNSCCLTKDFFLSRLVIAFLLETTDSVPNSNHIFHQRNFALLKI